jgi:hypothetical protein
LDEGVGRRDVSVSLEAEKLRLPGIANILCTSPKLLRAPDDDKALSEVAPTLGVVLPPDLGYLE